MVCAAQLEVARREVPAEVVRQEMVVEMERRRKLNEIYSQRKDLEIEVESPQPVPVQPLRRTAGRSAWLSISPS